MGLKLKTEVAGGQPKKRVVIFDLDGCLSDHRHRLHLAHQKKYDEYHSLCKYDAAMNKRVLEYYVHHIDFHIVFLTGRNERWRLETAHWIMLNLGMTADEYRLFMRPDGDKTPAPEFKLRVVTDELEFNEVYAAYDDRDDIIAAYRRKGIVAVKMNEDGVKNEPIYHSPIKPPPPPQVSKPDAQSVPEILRAAAAIYEERNKTYGDNYKEFAPLMEAFFPNGISKEIAHSNEFGVFMMMAAKMSRLANGLNHQDTADDICVYAAMMSELIREKAK